MSNETIFYICGGALVVVAVLVSFFGLRTKGFPSRTLLVGLAVLTAALVGATGAFALLQAEDEQDARNAELAAEESAATAQEGAAAQEGKGTVLDVVTAADAGFSFDPDGLEAAAGTITLSYDNEQAIGHNIALELDGTTIAESDTISESTTELTEELAPGQYLFYCTIPGHRQAGMEGTLTVTGSE